MLTRRKRLRKKKEFEEVFKKGKGFKGDFLVLKILKGKLREARFGFVVSQKVSKKAVIRNKVKRRLRAIIKEKEKGFKKGFEIVIIALPGAEKKNFWEVKKTLEKLFKSAKVLNPIESRK